ncbi:hypothetical protein [uncultured Maricaulis sp.]|uniref:hypothetical protein n=1 Tax=uncultured Maricaulis sp. TaxID=174710 RepID=UPI0030D8C19C
MTSSIKTIITAIVTSLPLTFGTPALADEPVNPLALVRAFDTAFMNADWDAAQAAGETLLANDRVSFMPAGYRADLHTRVGLAYASDGDTEAAERHWAEAELLGAQRRNILVPAFETAISRDDGSLALRYYRELDSGFGETRNTLRLTQVQSIPDFLHADGEHDREAEALALITTNYTPDNPFAHLDSLTYRHIRSRVERGLVDDAMALLPDMTSAASARRLRVLNLFEPLWSQPDFDSLTDLRAETLDLLERSRADSAAYPNHLEPVIDQMAYLVDLGRLEEASDLVSATWRRMRSGESFEDADEQTAWMLDRWARIELGLGRIAFGKATLERGSRFNESGMLNVSQHINLAHLEVDLGEDRAALDRLSDMETRGASEYGWLQVHLARACAASALDEPDILATSLAFAEDHRALDPWGYETLLICLGREDDAAAYILQRLNDPSEAEALVVDLQPREPRYTDPAFVRYHAEREARARILERADIQAAIARTGRIETIRIRD